MQFLKLWSARLLPEWAIGEGLRVELIASPENSTSGPYRLSPIHPLIETTEIPDLGKGSWSVHLLVPCDAFRVLGKISRLAYPGLERQTWFGIGLASVILFLRDSSEIDQLVEDLNTDLLAHELWTVKHGDLVNRQLLREPATVGSLGGRDLPVPGHGVPSDLRGIIEEFDHSFNEIYRWSRAYATDEVGRLSALFHDVADLVSELSWLYSERTSSPPDGLAENDLTSPLERARLIQQRSDRIVQINSALSYVISQGFFGAPPVLSDCSLIQRHSLLGIGRAHRALLNLVREIESAFRELSIPTSVYERWKSFPKLSGFDSGKELDSSRWHELNLPDVVLTGTAGADPFKLAYFSGRLGFRESEYSVSAAIHSLTSGDAPDWHLSTMTHEMLHSHVRDILHAVFDRVRDDDPDKIEAYWHHIFSRFKSHMLGRHVDGFMLVDSIRSMLLSYCCLVREMGSLTQLASRPIKVHGATRIGQMWVPDDPAQLKRQLAEENRSISEIVVHTLDLFYFYFDNFEAYNRAVWTSWRSVPAVLRDVRQYVLRMLLAYTSLDKGDEIGRFARARNQVRDSIKRLNTDLKRDPVLEQAIELLDLPKRHSRHDARTLEGNHPLFQPFFAALRIADLSRHCLTSGRIREALFDRDIIRLLSGDTDLDFGFTAGDFSDREVQSVAEFTAWRARCSVAMTVAPDGRDVERRTAWLLIACGSIPNGRDIPSEPEVRK